MLRYLIGLYFLLLCSALYGETVEDYDPQTMSFPVTLEQAQNAARQWIAMPELVFRDYVMISSPDDHPLQHRYVLNTPQHAEEDEQQFIVDCHSGEVMWWANAAEARREAALYDSAEPPPALAVEERIAIARAFAEQKYSGFHDLNLQSTEDCRFVRRLPNDVWDLGFYAVVGTNRYTGTVTNYTARRCGPLSISTEPLIDLATAEAIALGAELGLPEMNSAWVTGVSAIGVRRDGAGVQRLIWEIGVVGSAEVNYTPEQYQADMPNPYGYENWIVVDAHTGEAFDFLGGPLGGGSTQSGKAQDQPAAKPKPIRGKKIPHPKCALYLNGDEVDTSVDPIEVSGEPYLYVRHLSPLGRKVSWKDGCVVVSGDEQVLLRPGSHTAQVGSREVNLDKPVVVYFDRAYIPLDAIRAIFGDVAKWDRDTRRIDLLR